MALLSGCVALAIGFLLVRALWPAELRQGTGLLRGCLAVGVGGGVVSIGYFAVLLLVGAANAGLLFGSEVALLVVLVAVNARAAATTGAGAAVATRSGPLVRVLLLLVITAAIASFALATVANPHGVADALGIWNLRAQLLFDSGLAWRRAITPEPTVQHVDYPMFLPALVARTWQGAGAATPVVSAAIAFGFTFATAGLLWGTLRQVRGTFAGSAAAAALLAFPAWIAAGATQYADVPLAFFHLATLALLALHDERSRAERGLLVLAGVTLGLAAWTKNEGLLFAVTVMVVRVAAGWRRGAGFVCRDGLAMLAGAAPVLVVLLVFKCVLVPANDLVVQVTAGKAWARVGQVDRWLEIAHGFAAGIWSLGPFVLVAVAVWCLGCRRDRLRQPAAVVALMLLGYFATYLGASVNLRWHLDTSCQRLLLQLLPMALLAVFSGRRDAGAVRVS